MPDIVASPTLTITCPVETLTLAGLAVPGHYGDPAAEYAAAVERTGVFDRSVWGRLQITGERPGAWLNGIVSNETAELQPGEGCRALLLTVKGRIACDMRIYATADGLWLETAFDTADGLAGNLRKLVLYGDRIEIHDARAETCHYTVQGPAAAECVRLATGEDPSSLAPTQILCSESLRIAAARLGEMPAYDVWAPRDQSEALWRRLAEHARPIGWRAAEMLRLAAGLPRWGAELTPEVLPLEAELPDALTPPRAVTQARRSSRGCATAGMPTGCSGRWRSRARPCPGAMPR